MKSFFVALLILTVFYLCTTILGFDGPGETLAFRPFHGLYPSYFVRDPDSPLLAIYHGNLPWWQAGHYITLFSTSYENTMAPWLAAYFLIYYATVLGWFVFLWIVIVRAIRFHQSARKSSFS